MPGVPKSGWVDNGQPGLQKFSKYSRGMTPSSSSTQNKAGDPWPLESRNVSLVSGSPVRFIKHR
jgi:hypothetical protein